jgi:hypothetical protein
MAVYLAQGRCLREFKLDPPLADNEPGGLPLKVKSLKSKGLRLFFLDSGGRNKTCGQWIEEIFDLLLL